MAPQDEMYPFVPVCGSTHWACVNTERNKFEAITPCYHCLCCELVACTQPAGKSGMKLGGVFIHPNNLDPLAVLVVFSDDRV